MERFKNIGVIQNDAEFDSDKLDQFEIIINNLRNSLTWTKKQIVNLFFTMIPEFGYEDKGKYLDDKM